MKTDHTNWKTSSLVILLLLGGIGLRYASLHYASPDMESFLMNWYDKLADGGFGVLRKAFYNYTPAYLYLLDLAVLSKGFLPKIAAIKLISISFDLCNAFLIYKLIKLKIPHGPAAALGAAAFLFLPTIFVNSAVWGQVDSIYTCFLLACIYALMNDRPLPAMIWLGISFSFKAQAVFLSPLVLLLIVRKKIPWAYLGIIPAVYLAMMVPAALAGRPPWDLITIYLDQSNTYRMLSMNAPNLYVFVPNEFYVQGVAGGIILAIVILLAWVIICSKKIREFTAPVIILSALVSVALVPFLLPKMHDRYFYPADVLSYALAFFEPGLWYVTLGYQLISGIVYFIYLQQADSQVYTLLLRAAAVLNGLIVTHLVIRHYRLINIPGELKTSKVSPPL